MESGSESVRVGGRAFGSGLVEPWTVGNYRGFASIKNDMNHGGENNQKVRGRFFAKTANSQGWRLAPAQAARQTVNRTVVHAVKRGVRLACPADSTLNEPRNVYWIGFSNLPGTIRRTLPVCRPVRAGGRRNEGNRKSTAPSNAGNPCGGFFPEREKETR